MNQKHNENRGVHSKSFIYCHGTPRCLVAYYIDDAYIEVTRYEWNNSKEEDSLSDSQGLLFVFEWIVVIKAIDEDIACWK